MTLVNFFIYYFLWVSILTILVSFKAEAFNWSLKSLPRNGIILPKLKELLKGAETGANDLLSLDKLELLKKAASNEIHPILHGKLLNWNELTYDIQKTPVPCFLCKGGAKMLMFFIRNGIPDHKILKFLSTSCAILGIQSAPVCEGIIDNFGTDLIYILKRIDITPMEFCSFFFTDACGDAYGENNNWAVNIPPKTELKISTERPIPKQGAPLLKVLHLSDVHFDPLYKQGSNADCSEPLCCRASSGEAPKKEFAAGRWGDGRKCDTPQSTVDSMLKNIAQNHKDIDYIIWTGDSPPHDIWNQSRSANLEIIKETLRQMSENFPNVPIFPALGNHDSAPVNSFPPPFIDNPDKSIAWLYEQLYTLWSPWLPETASETIRRGAFYSVLLRPGLRLISLNMNYCNNLNWWLLFNSTDPAGQLQWFISELQNAELSNEKVHVIGHIPPGCPDCLKVWSRNFYEIIARFEDTIVAQFYGHTHFDEFEVFYHPKNWTHPTSVAYIGPSVSPFESLNPAYRIYYIDGNHNETTNSVVDHETWIMDLELANSENLDNPVWFKLYSAREAYGLEALRPSDWAELSKKMSNDNGVFERYYEYYWKGSPKRPGCKTACRKRLTCDSKSGRSHDRKQFCSELDPNILLRTIKRGTSTVEAVVNFVTDIF